jgi:hypothetical protein
VKHAYHRRLAAVACAVVLAFAIGPARAQESGATEAAIEQLSSDYTAIAGGWWLDQRCRALPFEQKIEYEWLVGQLTDAISNELGVAWTAARQKSAKEIAEGVPCDDAAAKLIGDSAELAREVTDQLTGLTFQLGVTDRTYLRDRYSALARGRAVADRCRFQTDAWRGEYRRYLDQIGTALGQRYTDINFNSLATDAQLEVDNSTIDCTPQLDTRIQGFYAAAKSLAVQLGLIAP